MKHRLLRQDYVDIEQIMMIRHALLCLLHRI